MDKIFYVISHKIESPPPFKKFKNSKIQKFKNLSKRNIKISKRPLKVLENRIEKIENRIERLENRIEKLEITFKINHKIEDRIKEREENLEAANKL